MDFDEAWEMPTAAPRFNRNLDHGDLPPPRFPEGASPQLRLILACQKDVALNGVGGARTRSICKEADCASNAVNYHFRSLEHLLYATIMASVERGQYWAEKFHRLIPFSETCTGSEAELLEVLYVTAGATAASSIEQLPGAYACAFYSQINAFNLDFYRDYWFNGGAPLPPSLLRIAEILSSREGDDDFQTVMKIQGDATNHAITQAEYTARQMLAAGRGDKEDATELLLKAMDLIAKFQYQGLTGKPLPKKAEKLSKTIRNEIAATIKLQR